jgi:hypothetical protein
MDQKDYAFQVLGSERSGVSALISAFQGEGISALPPASSKPAPNTVYRAFSQHHKTVRLSIHSASHSQPYLISYKMRGFIVLYDITSHESFSRAKDLIGRIKANGLNQNNIILVESKVDLEENRKVSEEEGIDFANREKVKFGKTSAVNGEGVREVFFLLTYMAMCEDEERGVVKLEEESWISYADSHCI